MLTLVCAFLAFVGIAAIWEVFRDSQAKSGDCPDRDPENSAYVSGLRQFRNSLWWTPTLIFGGFLLLSGVDFTKEVHLWVHQKNQPLIAIVPAPGQLEITRGASSHRTHMETFVMLTDWGERVATKTHLPNGGVHWDVDEVSPRLGFHPTLLASYPRSIPQLRKLLLPYWFFGLVIAGIVLAITLVRRRSRSHRDAASPPPSSSS